MIATTEKQANAGHNPQPALDLEDAVPEAAMGVPAHLTESAASNPYGSRPACFSSNFQEGLFVVTTTFAVAQNSILSGALTVMTSKVQESLNMNSSEVTWLVAAQGLTAGAIYEKPSRRKNRAFACFSAGNPIGFVLGALIGGIATDIASWRASIWVITIVYAFLTCAAYFTTPKDAEQSVGKFNTATLSQMDWLGAFLAVTGISTFTAAFTLAPDATNGWQTPYVPVLLVIGVVFVTAFLYWQSVFKHPLMPLWVWKDRNFALLVASLCLGFYGFNDNFFWLSLGFQRVYVNSPLEVAVKFLPAAIGGTCVNFLAAMIMHRVSNKLLSILGATAVVSANVLLSASSKSISFWALAFPAQLLMVLGQDIAFCVTNLYVMSSMPSEQQSVAGGMFLTVTRFSATVGLGISTTVYAAAGGTTEVSRSVPWRPYQSTFWVSLVGSVFALFLACFLTIGKQGNKQKPGEREKVTEV
ncbi:hypothetical protein LTR66_015784 [Elasticomyces elasticus]|nr:hypothetical protein LTR66_015784 [Elasticomyces elasticus]